MSSNNITLLFKTKTFSFHKQTVYKQTTEASGRSKVGLGSKLIVKALEKRTLEKQLYFGKYFVSKFLAFMYKFNQHFSSEHPLHRKVNRIKTWPVALYFCNKYRLKGTSSKLLGRREWECVTG